MSQQISIEDAFPTFQKKVRELFEANLLLQAQNDILERKLAAAQEGNSRLQQAGAAPAPSGGPDLATQPPHPGDDLS